MGNGTGTTEITIHASVTDSGNAVTVEVNSILLHPYCCHL